MKKQILILPAIIFLLILLVFFYLLKIDRSPSEIPSALINKKVPEFQTKSLFNEKEIISSKIFQDKIIVVNFFATWCKPCRKEHDFIKQLSKINNLKIVGINYKDNDSKTINWLKELGNPYSEVIIDKKGLIGIEWGVYGIPETFIVNSNGIIKYRHVGAINNKIYAKMTLLINELETK